MSQSLDDLNAALDEAIADYEADTEGPADDVWYDLATSVLWNFMTENPPTDERVTAAREFCRIEFGYIPGALEQFLGRADWLDA